MQKIRWAILLLGIIVLLVAVLQNSKNAPLKLFFYETQLPVSVLLLVTSAISFLIGALTMGRMLKRSAKSRTLAEKPVEKPALVEPKTMPPS